MTKNEIAKIAETMPSGLDPDDYIVELVNRALFLEREACIKTVEAEVANWDSNYKEAVLEAAEAIRGRK